MIPTITSLTLFDQFEPPFIISEIRESSFAPLASPKSVSSLISFTTWNQVCFATVSIPVLFAVVELVGLRRACPSSDV